MRRALRSSEMEIQWQHPDGIWVDMELSPYIDDDNPYIWLHPKWLSAKPVHLKSDERVLRVTVHTDVIQANLQEQIERIRDDAAYDIAREREKFREKMTLVQTLFSEEAAHDPA